jgi:hypothetical protein
VDENNTKVQFALVTTTSSIALDHFKVDAGTGLITLKKAVDFETNPSFAFGVSVTNHLATTSRTSTSPVVITIADYNDNYPIFTAPDTPPTDPTDMNSFAVYSGTVRLFHHGFCCVRFKVVGMRLLYGARFPAEIYTRVCHWFPRLLA